MDELSGTATRFAEELRQLGVSSKVVEMPDSTRSAADAAAAIGCDISQIVKSLVFRSVDARRTRTCARVWRRPGGRGAAGRDSRACRAGHGRVCTGPDGLCHWRRASGGPPAAARYLSGRTSARPRRRLGRGGHTTRRFLHRAPRAGSDLLGQGRGRRHYRLRRPATCQGGRPSVPATLHPLSATESGNRAATWAISTDATKWPRSNAPVERLYNSPPMLCADQASPIGHRLTLPGPDLPTDLTNPPRSYASGRKLIRRQARAHERR